MNPEWIGTIAGVLTTGAYVPQAVKAFRERHTSGVSLLMYMMMVAGNASWLAYGWLIDSPSVMFSNAITVTLATAILAMKLKHG